MEYNKILVIGSTCSGKSTIAAQIGNVLGIKVLHLDKIYWLSNYEHISAEEFDSKLSVEFENDKWIMDGNYNRTISTRFEECDTVIYFDFPKLVCLIGAFRGFVLNKGKYVGKKYPESFNSEYLRRIWDFNKNNKMEYLDMLENCSNKNIYIFHRRKDSREFLARLKTSCAKINA